MARLNDDAQWIILMGFLVSFSLFFLAIVINQSTVVGQTTAESVIEFPKNDIRDISHVIKAHIGNNGEINDRVYHDIKDLSIQRKGAVVNYTIYRDSFNHSLIHYNNGVTTYSENWTSN
ncbi:MAG: hypothetical protein CVV34_06270 [Methanomicrobiales archaeon HGW-Methanomicrobiales-5]|nr:MAG: hypothetical protein CVV34_06270 [Methanomicrobiales archaeon HGW-Methanomicrobiales-5]